MKILQKSFTSFLSLFLFLGNAYSAYSKEFFASLKVSEVNVRTGPGIRYPIKWMYIKKNLPIEVKARFENWYHIVDEVGEKGWVHTSLISHARYFRINRKEVTLYKTPVNQHYPVIVAEKGVRGKLVTCRDVWCQVKIKNYIGWLHKEEIWGVYHNEEF